MEPHANALVCNLKGARSARLKCGRTPMRAGTVLYSDPASENPIGKITSGGFGPTIEGPMSMGYVLTENAAIGVTIYADVRGKRLPATVSKMPFTPANFKR